VVLTKNFCILVPYIVVLERNLSIMEERRPKDEGMLALIENKQRLVVNYAPNINFDVFIGLIEHPSVLRNCF
jgi:hypothetical protein